jgi:sirohydrochlorin cobaltochelatase
MNRCIILFAHGARDPEWARPFERLRASLAVRTPDVPVSIAYLEFMQPDLAGAVAACAAGGATVVDVVPVFMAQGAHLKRDLPKLVADLGSQFPQVRFQLQPPVGESQAVLDAIAAHIDGSLKQRV